MHDTLRACPALCLPGPGRDREGLSLVLEVLAPHLPRYQRQMGGHARALVAE